MCHFFINIFVGEKIQVFQRKCTFVDKAVAHALKSLFTRFLFALKNMLCHVTLFEWLAWKIRQTRPERCILLQARLYLSEKIFYPLKNVPCQEVAESLLLLVMSHKQVLFDAYTHVLFSCFLTGAFYDPGLAQFLISFQPILHIISNMMMVITQIENNSKEGAVKKPAIKC